MPASFVPLTILFKLVEFGVYVLKFAFDAANLLVNLINLFVYDLDLNIPRPFFFDNGIHFGLFVLQTQILVFNI